MSVKENAISELNIQPQYKIFLDVEADHSKALTTTIKTSHPHNFVVEQTSAEDGDTIEIEVFLLTGYTYELRICGIKNSDCGILDWTLDGVSIAATQDWYAAGETLNTWITVSSVTVTTSGAHTLLATVNGKNASSSAYKYRLTSVDVVGVAS